MVDGCLKCEHCAWLAVLHIFASRLIPIMERVSESRMRSNDFQGMSRQELRSYLLSHRNDLAAISAYVKKISAEGEWVTCPALNSPADLDNYPAFLAKIQREAS
jgi:hypothetical protein